MYSIGQRFLKKVFIVLCGFFFFILFSPVEANEKAEFIKAADIEYKADEFRDPFCPEVSILQKEETKAGQIKADKPKASELFKFLIQGIIWNSDNPLVIINNQVFKESEVLVISKNEDAVEEVIIMAIDKDGVTIDYQGQIERLLSPAALELDKMKSRRKE